MAIFREFKFGNGLAFKYFISTKDIKGEDRHVVTESLVKYLENLRISSICAKEGNDNLKENGDVVNNVNRNSTESENPNPESSNKMKETKPERFDAYKDIDFGDLSERIKDKFGDMALFAVLDGHSGFYSPQRMFDQIAENLTMALANTIEKKIGECEEPKELLENVAIEFPQELHNTLKNHLVGLHVRDSNAAEETMYAGTTFSFLIFTHELAASGIVGDSPVALISRNDFWQSYFIHDLENPKCFKAGEFGPDVLIDNVTPRKTYIGFPYASDLLMYNTVGDVFFDHDMQVAFHKRQYGQQLTEEEEKCKRMLEDGEKRIPFNRRFSTQTPPKKYDHIFTRKATVKVASLKIRTVTGGILCTDGVLEELPNYFKKVEYESEDFVFGNFIDMGKGDDDKTIIEVKISTMNTF